MALSAEPRRLHLPTSTAGELALPYHSCDSGLPKAGSLSSCCWLASRTVSISAPCGVHWQGRKWRYDNLDVVLQHSHLMWQHHNKTPPYCFCWKFLLSGTPCIPCQIKNAFSKPGGPSLPRLSFFSLCSCLPHWNIYCFDVNLHQEPGGIWQHFVSDRQHSLLLWSPFSEKQFFM